MNGNVMKQFTSHQIYIHCERNMAEFETLLRNIGQIHSGVIKMKSASPASGLLLTGPQSMNQIYLLC